LHVLAAGSLRAPFDALAAEWRHRSPLAVAVSYANARDLAGRIGQNVLRAAGFTAFDASTKLGRQAPASEP
jgi:ABC-type molybdate transport system substrate-binding protein